MALRPALRAQSRLATEQPPKRRRTGEQPAPAAMPLRWDDEFWLEEIDVFTSDVSSLPGKHHSRRPDLAMRIRIYIWVENAWQEFSGVYLGHGQSKTTFRLVDGASKTNGVLKVARKEDMEPGVFAAISQYGLCPPILHNGLGKHANDRRSNEKWHCWITERTIPLDEFVKSPMANRSQCTLAALICLLECASLGLYVTDTHFFNFGVRLFSDFATEHAVLLIDAGSRGWHPGSSRWSKADLNSKMIRRFWDRAQEHNAQNPDLQQLWRTHHDVGSALAAAKAKWTDCPLLTDRPVRLQEILEGLDITAERGVQDMKRTSAYIIIDLVANQKWQPTDTFHAVCYRAYKKMQTSPEQDTILDDLHWRITNARDNASVGDVISFWYSLLGYRERVLSKRPWRCSDAATLTRTEVTEALHDWEEDFLWYEATDKQWRLKGTKKTSFLRAMLNKKAAWSYAAMAVLEIGLPSLTLCDEPYAATERVRAMATFANAMVRWLENLSTTMVRRKENPGYQAALEYSKLEIPKADRGAKPPPNWQADSFRCVTNSWYTPSGR